MELAKIADERALREEIGLEHWGFRETVGDLFCCICPLFLFPFFPSFSHLSALYFCSFPIFLSFLWPYPVFSPLSLFTHLCIYLLYSGIAFSWSFLWSPPGRRGKRGDKQMAPMMDADVN